MITLHFREQVKNKNRISVFFGAEYLFSVSKYTYRKLAGADTLTVESVAEFQKACLYPENYNYCLDILSKKAYTKRELSQKLSGRGCTPEITEEILTRLEEERLICDEDYREEFVRSRQTYKKHGFLKIRQDLYRKGITVSVEEYDKEMELSNLRELVEKLIEKKTEPKKILSRLTAKGYRFSEILSCIRQVNVDGEDEDFTEYEESYYDEG